MYEECRLKEALSTVVYLCRENLFSIDETVSILNRRPEISFVDEFVWLSQFINQAESAELALQSVNTWSNYLKGLLMKTVNAPQLRYSTRLVHALLADYVDKVYWVYKKNKLKTSFFFEELRGVIRSFVTILPEFLKKSNFVLDGKRQPSFLEATEATIVRLEKVEELQHILEAEPNVVGFVLGGSLSYGPFFNTRPKTEDCASSDIDIIVVVDGMVSFALNPVFINTTLFREEDKRILRERLAVFYGLNSSGAADILSQDFEVPGTDFYLDLHFFSVQKFENICGNDFEEALMQEQDSELFLREYNLGKLERRFFFFGFDGLKTLSDETPKKQALFGGSIEPVPVYKIKDYRAFFGRYLLILAPSFLVFWDRNDQIKASVRRFKDIMRERFESDRKRFSINSHFLRFHLRYPLFSPVLLSKNK